MIYVWPSGLPEGEDFPEDFWRRLTKALRTEGIEWEPAP